MMIWGENFYGVPFVHLIFHLITIEENWIFIFSRISVFNKDISHHISALLTFFVPSGCFRLISAY